MQKRQSVVLGINSNGVRRVRDEMVSVSEERLPKPQPQSKAFSTRVVVRERDTDDVIISSGRRESTSPGRIESQKHRHTHRPYWNSDRQPTH